MRNLPSGTSLKSSFMFLIIFANLFCSSNNCFLSSIKIPPCHMVMISLLWFWLIDSIRVRADMITNAFLVSGFVIRIQFSWITNSFAISCFVIRIRTLAITNAFPISCFVVRIRVSGITNTFSISCFVIRIRTTIYSSAYESFKRFYDLISNNGIIYEM